MISRWLASALVMAAGRPVHAPVSGEESARIAVLLSLLPAEHSKMG
jgi:hypothetical protein